MKDKSYWLSSGTYTMLHSGIDFVLGFMGFMMLVRILSQTDFGTWVLLITILAIVEVARKGFLQNGMIKFLVGNVEESKPIQSAALMLNVLLTGLIMAVLWFSAPALGRLLNAPGLAEIIRVYVFLLPVLILHTHNLILMQSKFDFRAFFWAGVSKSVPFFFCISYFFWTGTDVSLYRLIWLYALCFVFASVVSLFQVRTYLRIGLYMSGVWIGRIFDFGRYVFGTNLISMLSNSMDKFLLGALLSPVQVALANTAGKVMNLTHTPVNSIASITYPKASEAHEHEDAKSVGRMVEQTTGMMLSITLPFFLLVVLFTEPVILFVAGEDYLGAAPFLLVISFLAVLRPFDRQFGVFLDAIGKPNLNLVMVIVNFVLLVVLSWILIEAFGLIGAAFGLVIAVFATSVLKYFLLRRFLPFSLFRPFAEAVLFWPQAVKYVLKRVKLL